MTHWQKIFKREGRVFHKPHKDISQFIEILRQIGAENVLDLGCGTGRHTIALARSGFRVYGIDISEEGIRQTKEWLRQENLEAALEVRDIYKRLPYKENFFDGVISTAVLHHARISKIKKLIIELERVMKPNGVLMIEVPKEKHAHEIHKEIEPGTFVPLVGPEKGLPHHVFTEEELKEFFHNFEILDVHPTGGTPTPHLAMFAKLKDD